MQLDRVKHHKYSFAVTGVSALIGQGILKSLEQLNGINKIGIDRRFSEYANQLCNEFYTKPSCSETSEEYLNFWKNLIQKHNLSLIIPGISHDVNFFKDNIESITLTGCRVVLNDLDLINLCSDKYQFHLHLVGSGIRAIPTVTTDRWSDLESKLGKPPYILKPKNGEGAQGIQIINDSLDFDYWSMKNKGNYIIQKIIGDEESEYTVGVFGTGYGKICDQIIIMRRKLSRAGNTAQAEVVDCDAIQNEVQSLCEIYKPIGPTNFQFRMEKGHPYLLEINPRFSSSNSLRTMFGFNEAKMCVEYYIDGKTPAAQKLSYGRAERQIFDLKWKK